MKTFPLEKVAASKSPSVKKNGSVVKTEKTSEEPAKDEEENEDADGSGNSVVAVTDYNPMKNNYHPIKDAAWKRGEAVPYMALARTLEQVIKIIA